MDQQKKYKCSEEQRRSSLIYYHKNSEKRKARIRERQAFRVRHDFNFFVYRMYTRMWERVTSRDRYKGMSICSRKEFLDFAINDFGLKSLYEEWQQNGYDRKLVPSVDRIDCRLGYLVSNIQFLTLSDNGKKAFFDRARIVGLLN